MERFDIKKNIDNKLNLLEQFDSNVDLNDFLDIAKSKNKFNSLTEFKNYITEGALLQINKLGSQAISIPTGQYMVLRMDDSVAVLVPTDDVKKENYELLKPPEYYEIHPSKLFGSWNKIEKIIAD